MNQNDMDRYRWRSGQRWSGDRTPSRQMPSRGKKFPLLLIIIGAFLFIAQLLSFHRRGPRKTQSFKNTYDAALQKPSKEKK